MKSPTKYRKQPLTIKGQLGVPLTVYPWYLLCSLGILGDEKTHKFPRDIRLIVRDFTFSGVRWDQVTPPSTCTRLMVQKRGPFPCLTWAPLDHLASCAITQGPF